MKKLITTILVLLLCFATSTFGQSVSDESLQTCANIEDLAPRLVCYDTLVASLPQTEEIQTEKIQTPTLSTTTKFQSGNWTYHSEVDAFDDTKSFMLLNEAIDIDTKYDNDTIYMAIICFENAQDLRLILGWDNFLGSEERIIVTYRIDSDSAIRRQWYITGNDNTNTLYSYGESTTLQLLEPIANSKTGKFIVQTEGYSQILSAEFDVSDLSEILHQVTEPCGL